MSPNAAAWRAHVWRSPVSWRSSCTGYGLTAPSSVGPSKPQRRYPLHDKRSSSSRLTRAEPRRSRGDDGRGDLAECPEPKSSNALKVAGQIGTPRSFSPHHAAAKSADREEKRVTYGNDWRHEEQLDTRHPNQRGHLQVGFIHCWPFRRTLSGMTV